MRSWMRAREVKVRGLVALVALLAFYLVAGLGQALPGLMG